MHTVYYAHIAFCLFYLMLHPVRISPVLFWHKRTFVNHFVPDPLKITYLFNALTYVIDLKESLNTCHLIWQAIDFLSDATN